MTGADVPFPRRLAGLTESSPFGTAAPGLEVVVPVLPFNLVIRVALDTNVLVAGLRSRRGASYALLSEIGRGRFEIAISVPVLLEYEEALLSQAGATGLTVAEVEAVLDYLCSVAKQQSIFYLWRPLLPDADDDMVLELAVAAGCDAVVTHNARDFRGAERFKVAVWTPYELSRRIGVLK